MINKIKKIARFITSVPKGFTLIETLVAILLLSVAIAGPLTIAQESLASALTAKDQVGAFYLAQDAVEYLRYVRDSNCLAAGGVCSSASWLAGLNGTSNGHTTNQSGGTPGSCISTDGTQACYVDTIQDKVTACTSVITCPTLNYDNIPTDSTYHYFGYTFGSVTPEQYIRTITITTPVGSNSNEAEISVRVQWTGQGGLKHYILVRENLFNWE